jgi:lipopolysaccharide heptosyltransferase I
LSASPPQAERILIVRPSALGDVCRTVPVLASLRAAYPPARIDWLVQDTFAAAVAAHPMLTEVVPFPRGTLGRDLRRGRLAPVLRWLRGVRGRRYDLVLECQGLARSAIVCAWTGAKTRVGYADARELGWLALTRRVAAPASMHTVDRMLALVDLGMGLRIVRDMRLYAREEDLRWARRSAGEAYVVLAPTSRWPGKQWPAERFGAVARALRARGERLVIIGAGPERAQVAPLLEAVAGDAGVVDLIGGTAIGQLMAVIAGSRLVIANDSAALHMAVGFARPMIGLYGPTRVALVGPYGREADVIQHAGPDDAPDHKDAGAGRRLMERITVDEVLEAAGRRLAGR